MPLTLCDVLPGAAAVLGVPDVPDELGLGDRYGLLPRVVVVLVDGLGHALLPRMRLGAGLLAEVRDGRRGELTELACTFPSVTPTNLVSLTTGVHPGAHGVLGFTVAVPGSDRRLTHVLWRDQPDPRSWQPVPTWFERLAAAGHVSAAVLPAEFLDSGLTAATYRGARLRGVRDGGADPMGHIVTAVRDELATARLVYAYTAVLDTAAHEYGIDSPQWQAAAAEVDELLGRLAESLPAGSLLLVTADHGGLDVDPEHSLDLVHTSDLRAGVRVVAGDPRVRYLHTLPGATSDVVHAWRSALGDRATVLTRDEAVASGRFGLVAEAHLERIGDVVVICRGRAAVFDSVTEPAAIAGLIGLHGAEEPAETAVPLIALAR